MELILYQNNSEKNKIGKNLTTIRTIVGTLRQQTSIVNPTIEVVDSSVILANYAYIPEFDRYYFINDIESVRNNLWSVSMKVDVLESYKSEIKENTALITRQENLYNLYLNDERMKFTSDTFTLFRDFPIQNFNGNGEFCILTCG